MKNVSAKNDKINIVFKNIVFVELLISFMPRNRPMNWLVYNVMKYHGMVGFSLYKEYSVLLKRGDKNIALGWDMPSKPSFSIMTIAESSDWKHIVSFRKTSRMNRYKEQIPKGTMFCLFFFQISVIFIL